MMKTYNKMYLNNSDSLASFCITLRSLRGISPVKFATTLEVKLVK